MLKVRCGQFPSSQHMAIARSLVCRAGYSLELPALLLHLTNLQL